MPADWTQGKSVLVTLTGIADEATPGSLKKFFNDFGHLVWIELDDHEKSSLRRAKLRFQPPPHDLSFFHPETSSVWLDGRQVRASFVTQPASDFTTIRTPLGNSCPGSMQFVPEALKFGLLTQPTTFMVKKEVDGGGLGLKTDFKRKKLAITFSVKSYGTYRIDIKFGMINGIHRMKLNNVRAALVIVINDAPVAWQKTGEVDESTWADQLVWSESDMWRRAVNIGVNRNDMTPISLSDTYVVDFGRWTAYWIELSKTAEEAWSKIETCLLDWNIKTSVASFTQAPNSPRELSSMLQDKNYGPATGISCLGDSTHVDLPFDVRYQLEVCLSLGIICEYNVSREFLEKLVQLSRPATVDRARARLILEYAADQGKKIWNPMDLLSDPAALTYYPATLHIPKYCALVRKVTVTPTRVFFSTPTVETTNRVIRQYKDDQERFLRIQFTDELLEGRVRSTDADRDDEIYTRVFRALSRGIRMGRWHWQFLAFGNSQVRENGAFMFCQADGPDDMVTTCAKIRAWMGDFKHIQVVAKYAARLGQCFSTTRLLHGLYPRIERIPDVKHGIFEFTDGVGKISPELASVIAHEWKLTNPPSAYQFRMGGCKGVLVAWPEVKGTKVQVRPSQEKFSAEYNGLEIIRCSQFSCATLNRQTITVLSCLGVPDDVFVDLMREQLANYNSAMGDLVKVVEMLRSCADENMTTEVMATMLLDGFLKSNEPFVRTLLQLWRSWSIKGLKEKARMVVDQGAFLLGCVDETGTLRGHSKRTEGQSKISRDQLPQIFLQVPDPRNCGVYKVITGLCIAGRNPSLHPGDIRVVEAVDVPHLRHLRDVVVFPLKGDRDIPSMCSGGDLDGDDFFVIWDQRFLPTEWSHPPMDYTAPTPVIETRESSIVNSLASFFVLFMKNDRLPLIAHAHLATADMASDGARNAKCLELAQLHSVAVDYVKSGVPAKWSKKLDPRVWPHFMEKGRRSYHSTSALGKLYDMVETQVFDSKDNYTLPFDTRILKRYALSNDMLKKARRIKTQYDIAMRRILGVLEVRTEFEVWTGFVMSKPRVGSDYKVQERVGREWASLKSQFQDICVEAAGDRGFNKLGPFIAAMYQVTWEEMRIALHEARQPHVLENGTVGLRRVTARSMPLISFPWLFPAELGRIARGSDEQISLIDLGISLPDRASHKGGHPNALSRGGGGVEELLDVGYTKTDDGRFIHRGEILRLFQHGDEKDEEEIDFRGSDGPSDSDHASSTDGEKELNSPPRLATKRMAPIDLLDIQEEGEYGQSILPNYIPPRESIPVLSTSSSITSPTSVDITAGEDLLALQDLSFHSKDADIVGVSSETLHILSQLGGEDHEELLDLALESSTTGVASIDPVTNDSVNISENFDMSSSGGGGEGGRGGDTRDVPCLIEIDSNHTMPLDVLTSGTYPVEDVLSLLHADDGGDGAAAGSGQGQNIELGEMKPGTSPQLEEQEEDVVASEDSDFELVYEEVKLEVEKENVLERMARLF